MDIEGDTWDDCRNSGDARNEGNVLFEHLGNHGVYNSQESSVGKQTATCSGYLLGSNFDTELFLTMFTGFVYFMSIFLKYKLLWMSL